MCVCVCVCVCEMSASWEGGREGPYLNMLGPNTIDNGTEAILF